MPLSETKPRKTAFQEAKMLFYMKEGTIKCPPLQLNGIRDASSWNDRNVVASIPLPHLTSYWGANSWVIPPNSSYFEDMDLRHIYPRDIAYHRKRLH